MADDFTLARLPSIAFGAGAVERLPDAIARHGRTALIVTGARSFRAGPRWRWLLAALTERGVAIVDARVSGEPSPADVDAIVAVGRAAGADVVVGIGGGSALDAAKATAGLLRTGTSAGDHLEGVGPGLPYPGPTVPFIAVPTTAGTGSEATRNAVLSVIGPAGYKRSFRDERLVAAEAIVDPDLLVGASPASIAANGMDALTQLLEALVSTRASPVTTALALRGLEAVRDGLLPWHAAAMGGATADPAAAATGAGTAGGAAADTTVAATGAGTAGGAAADTTVAARSAMALAALLSGICLANAGLGVVHGLASPLGAAFPIPHGAACGAVLVAGTEANLLALASRASGSPALARYAAAGRILASLPADTPAELARSALVDTLRRWRDAVGTPGLAAWGIGGGEVPALVAGSRGSSMRTNPVELTDDEIAAVVRASR
jgi:alcohol dehydrogenase